MNTQSRPVRILMIIIILVLAFSFVAGAVLVPR
jgi:hypothetical protein